uniref:WASH1 WAHD domain-containing protein n=1 Tax=Arundo donax TaxID=35708 RepID=A0A0A9EVJ1_ARUDO
MLRVSEDGGGRRGAHASGYGDLGRALLDLQAAADQVFDAVSKRTAEEHEKLSAISRRIKDAKAKIKALSQSDEPLTIVLPARHPSSSTKHEDFRPLFHDKYNGANFGLPIANIAVNGGFNREYGLEGTLELFQFFSEENCDYPSKATDKLPKTKDGTYLENLLETAKHPTAEDHLASEYDVKSEELPPPPPSLLPKHIRTLKSGDVRAESDVNTTSP